MKKRLLKSKRKQQGIALIFALAMLALLLIMAMGFATSSIFEQKSAANSACTSNARVLAQSALNRVLTLLNVYGPSIQYSYEKNNITNDMLSHLTTTINGAPLYTYPATPSEPVSWEYIKSFDGTNNRLLGRFAYRVIPVAGIDPGALVAAGVDESLDAEQRPGNNISEMNLMSVNTTDITSALAKKFNYTTVGLYPGPATGWQSFKNLFTLTGITDTTLQTKFLKWFMLDTARLKAKEAYQISTTPATNYHRFNLARSWDAADFPVAYPPAAMYNKILLDSSGDGTPDGLPTVYTNSGAENGAGLPWLAFFGYNADGTIDLTQGATFGSNAAGLLARRRQIAANLVDYCRTDTNPPLILPTSDVNPANWYNGTTWGTIPTFTGNKRTPYINELGFHIMVEAEQVASSGTPVKGKGKGHAYGRGKKDAGSSTTIDLSVDLEAIVEVVDIYGVTLPAADSTLTVDFTWSFDVSGTGGTIPTVTVPEKMTFTIQNADWGSPQGRYATPAAWVGTANTQYPINNVTVSSGTAVNISVNNIKVQVNKAVLNYNGQNYDYACINTASAPETITSTISAGTTGTVDNEFFISFQANDPRQNLNAGDWTVNKSAIILNGAFTPAAYNSYGGTLDAKNNFGISATGLDTETAADPVTGASTAYIRQGPMQSPWELGLIHRGKAWETLNLKAFDSSKATTFVNTGTGIIPGGAAYIAGDGNILNQIKMNSNTDNYKVNINAVTDLVTNQNVVLQALLRNIPIGSSCADPGNGSGTKISNPASLITAITAKTYQTRAAIAALAALYDGSCGVAQATDAKKEELVGKFINLTEVNGKYYYIIVLAQTIKDIGGPNAGTADITIRKKKSDGTVITIPTRLGQFDCDAANNIYADEIIAEQKIKVLVSLEPPLNTPRIISYEFIE